ncbi:transcriptional regulatory protein [Leucobacter sp. Psy1]|uniref:response regulator n=1 Tax=Leucobacter sp. Psy1 TaxID=2875729 RepID=UPI001CD2A159|nr:response regulator [Leucobacter sp. Psy1]UBH07031.1 transcriptional regulatory protein [Leucobacter sp. Psy1]
MIRVLVVDDEALTLELHRGYVEKVAGFTVAGEASSARGALTMAMQETDRFDLVLLDMTMPDGSGLDVLRHLRSRGVTLDVIAITAVRDSEIVRQVLALGAVNYLVKPFTFAMFRDRLEAYARYREQAEQASGASTQAEIDAMLGMMHPPVQTELPKGLSSETLALVSADVREHGPVSARESSARLGVSRVVVRRYLEQLVTEGRVHRAPRYGSPGRPVSEYHWAGAGESEESS